MLVTAPDLYFVWQISDGDNEITHVGVGTSKPNLFQDLVLRPTRIGLMKFIADLESF